MQIKTKIVCCHKADSKPVKQEVNGTVILPPLVFHGQSVSMRDYYINVMCVDKNKNVILINVIGSNVAAPSKVMFAVFFLSTFLHIFCLSEKCPFQ